MFYANFVRLIFHEAFIFSHMKFIVYRVFQNIIFLLYKTCTFYINLYYYIKLLKASGVFKINFLLKNVFSSKCAPITRKKQFY